MVTLPALLRSATPVFLEAVFRSLRTYRVAVKPLAEVLRATRSTEILDLGSGGAGCSAASGSRASGAFAMDREG